MLLCDRISRLADLAKAPRRIGLPRGVEAMPAIVHQLAACSVFAKDLRRASVRYVLGDDVVEAATTVVTSRPVSIRDCTDSLRVPWPVAWVEWREAARIAARRAIGIAYDNGQDAADRLGFLVEAEPDGRRGRVRFAWSHPPGDWESEFPTFSPFAIRFDFDLVSDQSLPVPSEEVKRGSDLYRKWARSPEDLAALDGMNRAFSFEPSPEAPAVGAALESVQAPKGNGFQSGPGIDAALGALLKDVAPEGLPFVATMMLLTARNGVGTRPEERTKLNRARSRRGEPLLLDHVVASLRLGRASASSASADGGDPRGLRRAHAVKGHFVTRSGIIFWRRAHTRGVGSGLPAAATRTVKVSM